MCVYMLHTHTHNSFVTWHALSHSEHPSQANWVDFSNFLENNSNLIFSSKDETYTTLFPPFLHPKEKGNIW